MPRILIVEDEPFMQQGLRDNLEFEGYQVDVASDGDAGLASIRKRLYDLVILDVMLPVRSGFDVCREARLEGIRTPIILLTARGEEMDKVRGLELGADDYITKPFSLRELLARVKAVLRRFENGNSTSTNDRVTIGRLTIDFDTFQAESDGKSVSMTHLEVEVLRYLFNHKNEVVTRADLLTHVWGYESQPSTRTVDNFILKLRQKIEVDVASPRHILTVHGIGYKLIP